MINKKKYSVVSFILITTLITASFIANFTTAFAADNTIANIQYSFSGDEKDKAGYAEGTITVTPNNADSKGTYYLFWANDISSLAGYREIAMLNITDKSSSFTFGDHTAIPSGATKLIALKSTTKPNIVNVSDATAVFDIPISKQFNLVNKPKLYSFASYSDIHITSESSTYPHDEIHWKAALETAAKHNVDFIVTSGDQVNNTSGYTKEWKIYQRILADSSYNNPIYESVGNHELWQGVSNGLSDFIKSTGLDSNPTTIKKSKAYYEFTEPNSGDHFIVMALEGGFYPNKVEEFTTEQLDWVESLLKKYNNDGHNVYIVEHSLFQGYGAGDRNENPFYDIPLSDNQASTRRLKSLLETYKDVVFFSGHTHISFGSGYNYSDENGTSARMIHNSSIGSTRRVVNDTTLDKSYILGESEGYIVDVYNGSIVFNGANTYYDQIIPSAIYIVDGVNHGNIPPTTTQDPTASSTTEQASSTQQQTTLITHTTEPFETQITTTQHNTTESSTHVIDTQPTFITTVPNSTDVTEITNISTTTPQTNSQETTQVSSTAIENIPVYGDATLDGSVSISDATKIQQFVAKLTEFSQQQLINSDLDGDGAVNIKDATLIQKRLADIIHSYPIETQKLLYQTVGSPQSLEFTSAKNDLNIYYRYSSYNQYQSLKKYCAELVNYSELSSTQTQEILRLHNNLLDIVDPNNIDITPSGPITIYYADNNNWNTVNAYIWGDGGKASAWPGTAMTYVGKNSDNNKIYSIVVDFSKYQKIIFNNGSTQTIDIELTGADNVEYYAAGTNNGKITCNTTSFKDSDILS